MDLAALRISGPVLLREIPAVGVLYRDHQMASLPELVQVVYFLPLVLSALAPDFVLESDWRLVVLVGTLALIVPSTWDYSKWKDETSKEVGCRVETVGQGRRVNFEKAVEEIGRLLLVLKIDHEEVDRYMERIALLGLYLTRRWVAKR